MELKLYNDDCIKKMAEMQSDSVDLTITSPPYDNLRNYNGNISQWSFQKFQMIAKELYRLTKNGGVVVWIVGDATVKGSETGTSFRQALYFKECGFNLHDTMIYQKSQACFGSNKCYLQSFEYMFVLAKGTPKTINFIRDRRNIRNGVESMAATGISKDGEKSIRIRKEMKEYGKRKNIWEYGVGGGKTGHPAVFPEALANDHIISWSNSGDTVFDPLMGSGTTGKMAVLNNRNFIGIEIDREYFEIAKHRINALIEGADRMMRREE